MTVQIWHEAFDVGTCTSLNLLDLPTEARYKYGMLDRNSAQVLIISMCYWGGGAVLSDRGEGGREGGNIMQAGRLPDWITDLAITKGTSAWSFVSSVQW